MKSLIMTLILVSIGFGQGEIFDTNPGYILLWTQILHLFPST